MTYSIVAALGREREIGIRGKIPWRLPEDLKRFKKLTTGHTLIMGRKTYESIGRPLPNRKNIIVTRNKGFSAPEECLVVGSLQEALDLTMNDPETFIIGGAEIYTQALPLVQRMYLTKVDGNFEADTFFPELDLSQWKIVETVNNPKSETNPFDFSFVLYERKKT